MPSVGSYLRGLRQRRGVSLDEISRSTRIPKRYLESLEGVYCAPLPAPRCTGGFIRAYCQALDEPPDEALACYDADRAGRVGPHVAQPHDAALPESQSLRESRTPRESRGRGVLLVSFVMLVVLGAALFAVTLALQPPGARRTEQRTSESAPSQSKALPTGVPMERQRTEDPSPSPPPRTPAATAPIPPAPATPAPAAVTGVASSYRLGARPFELQWGGGRTEDGRMSEENIPAGEIRDWGSDRPLVPSIANAGGVTLEL